MDESYEEHNDEIGKMETFKDVEKIKKDFRDPSNWLQRHFRNPHFRIEDNEGGGDCFFAVIRDAFESIGKNISVAQLRRILANEVTQEFFDNYKYLYDTISADYQSVNKNVSDIIKVDDELMVVRSVGFGTTSIGPVTGIGTTTIVTVERGVLGTEPSLHSDYTGTPGVGIARIFKGSYNIVNDEVHFIDAPKGNSSITRTENNLKFQTSEFTGRAF